MMVVAEMTLGMGGCRFLVCVSDIYIGHVLVEMVLRTVNLVILLVVYVFGCVLVDFTVYFFIGHVLVEKIAPKNTTRFFCAVILRHSSMW